MLAEALASVELALKEIAEPFEIIVVANGAPRERYDPIVEKYRVVTVIHDAQPCGFSAAIRRGMDSVRYDWTLLLNNDMTLESTAIRRLAEQRAPDVFAIAAEILQRSADGRREETGFVDWYLHADTVHVFHAPPPHGAKPREHLCASGGASLFRTDLLRRYASDTGCYDPFYWEDVEWGVRARRDGYRVLFCSGARARHRHRATTARFYSSSEIDRIVERNRILFDLRNAVTRRKAAWLLQRVCDQPYRSQRELSAPSLAAGVFRQRLNANRNAERPQPPLVRSAGAITHIVPSYSYRFGMASGRPRVLMVTPFCAFPPRHGGARRIEGLLQRLRQEFDIVLVSDEAVLYDIHAFHYFDGLRAVSLVQRPDPDTGEQVTDLAERIQAHCHDTLMAAVREAVDRYRPVLVQIEHVELAALSSLRMPGQRWILGLHDAFRAEDFHDSDDARRLQAHVLASYDAVTVCSPEDQALVRHPRIVCVPNGTSVPLGDHAPSGSSQLLFMGPFRYAPNLEGIRRFLQVAYPRIKDAVPNTRLLVLGGDGAQQAVSGEQAFAQADVEVVGHRDDIRELLAASALTLNPLRGIRGSSVKLIESLAAGRVCVSTEDGARGFIGAGHPGLVIVRDVPAMANAIIRLLENPELRHRIEVPNTSRLVQFEWQNCAGIQSDLYRDLLEDACV